MCSMSIGRRQGRAALGCNIIRFARSVTVTIAVLQAAPQHRYWDATRSTVEG